VQETRPVDDDDDDEDGDDATGADSTKDDEDDEDEEDDDDDNEHRANRGDDEGRASYRSQLRYCDETDMHASHSCFRRS
jgi:hypothetical protein